jgi:peptidoglycan/xylan/chitin deacetylase (PgdA/CDA1 family)
MGSTLPVRILRRLGRYGFGRLGCVKPARIAWPGGAVSFSFDDFPHSALAAGGDVLERHGSRGTYYTALGLAGTRGELGPMLEPGDVLAAHCRGHEIACHTFRHLDCSRAAAAAIIADLAENAAALSDLLGDFVAVNFAYPYGDLSLGAKRMLAPRFWSCRGIGQGFNTGLVDLAELRATRIHARSYDAQRFRALIDRNRAANGWLIFYTHDVADSPSRYGCTVGQLDEIAGYAAECGAVLPVRDVLRQLRAVEA